MTKKMAATKKAPMMKINMQKLALPALIAVLALALVVTLVITIPSANEVETAASEKIGYTYYSTDLNVERLSVVAAIGDDGATREYLAVLHDNQVTVMVELTAKQYMLLREGSTVGGHLVAMTDGTAVFTFSNEGDPNTVICYSVGNQAETQQ